MKNEEALKILKNANEGAIIAIQWVDSMTEIQSLDWQDAHKLKAELQDQMLITCSSVGFLVAITDRALTMAGHVSDGGCVCHVMHIPVQALVGAEVLVKPNPAGES